MPRSLVWIVQQYSDPSAPLGILVNHHQPAPERQAVRFRPVQPEAGRYDDCLQMSADPPTGTTPPSLTWTVGAVTQEAPLGFMGMGPAMVADLIVSDAVFDGLSDQLLQLGPINPGSMTIKSDDPDAAVEAIERLYKATVGGNFSYYSAAEFNQSHNLQTLMINLFFYGFLTLITLIGVTNIDQHAGYQHQAAPARDRHAQIGRADAGGFLRMLRYESLFYGLTALLYGLPLGIALSVFIYSQFGGVSTFAFTLPWGAIVSLHAGHPGDRLRHHDGLWRDDPQRQHRGYDQRRKWLGSAAQSDQLNNRSNCAACTIVA